MEQLHRLLEQLLPPDDNGPPLVDLPSDDDGPGAHGAGPPACHYGLEALPDSDDGMPGRFSDDDDDDDDDDDGCPVPEPLPDSDDESCKFEKCCKRGCKLNVGLHLATTEAKENLRKQNAADGNHMLMSMIAEATSKSGDWRTRNTWMIGDTIVCRPAWCAMHGVGDHRVGKLCTLLRTTKLPPTDLRKHNKGGASSASSWSDPSRLCDAFFSFAYDNLAENLAETFVEHDRGVILEDTLLPNQDHDCFEHDLKDVVVSQCCTNLSNKDIKWLAFHTIPDLYEVMSYWVRTYLDVANSKVPSSMTFRRVLAHWSAVLKIRPLGTHGRCTECAEDAERLAKTSDPETRADILTARDRHLASMMADRDLETNLDSLSEASCKPTCSFPGRILKLDMDGMDQAKFRAPRNISNASSMKNLWRPALHVVGIIVWGLFEAYVLMEPDIQKDANMQVTMLCMALQWSSSMLAERGLTLPLHLVIQADNTCRETKNNCFLVFCAMLVTLGIFKSVSVHFHRMGHTHGPIDQRFSVVATAIARKKVLQTLPDFAEAILKGVAPARNRKLMVHVCNGTYNFAKWLWVGTGITTPGITPNPHTKELHTNHCWRCVQRQDLPTMEKARGAEWQPVELDQSLASEEDAVLLLKEWESSQCLSQAPLVLLPNYYAKRLVDSPIEINGREALGPRAIKEYRITANVIERDPWFLTSASQWLRSWVAANESGHDRNMTSAREAFPFALVPHNRVYASLVGAADPVGWHRFAPHETLVRHVAALVTANPKPKAKAVRRGAAHAKAAVRAEPPEPQDPVNI